MDYKNMIDIFRGIACVVCYTESGKGGEKITIASANRNYLASVNKLEEEFVPYRPYSYYITSDPNFEALVKSCITSGKISHQYVKAYLYNSWLDIYMIPLEEDKDGSGYCLFTYEMQCASETDRMINISPKSAYQVLKTCIKFSENYDFKETLDSIVRDIRNQCESEGCAIVLTDRENRRIDICSYDRVNTEAFAPDEVDIFFKPEFYDIVESWQDIMAGSNCYIVSDEEELKAVEKRNARWYNSLIMSGVRSLVLYPLRVGGTIYGYIFATNFNSDNTAFIREMMELNSFVLSGEVENYRMRKKLEMLGTTDMLTGVYNRNAMNRRIAELEEDRDSGCGLGAVFVDLNGLKTANDSRGHDKGDEMLINVASKLKTVFSESEIYRAGGDEFLILSTEMNRDDFYAHFDQLALLSRVEGEPAFALGAHYEDDRKDIGKIMNTADHNMYIDKTQYYESHPEMDRRIC